jgi:hypothetical protein
MPPEIKNFFFDRTVATYNKNKFTIKRFFFLSFKKFPKNEFFGNFLKDRKKKWNVL